MRTHKDQKTFVTGDTPCGTAIRRGVWNVILDAYSNWQHLRMSNMDMALALSREHWRGYNDC